VSFFFKFPKLNISVQLLIILFGTIAFGHFIPEIFQSFFYAMSITLKDFLLFVLPAVIFSCLFSCLLTFRGGKAVGFMLLLFFIVCVSNYAATLIAYCIGSLNLVDVNALTTTSNAGQAKMLLPLWDFEFPKWISNDIALYLGFGFGSLFSFFPSDRAYQFSLRAKRFVTLLLEKGFIPVLPLFAFGFILKIQFDGMLTQVIESYLPIMLLIITTYVLYLIFLFALVSNFNFKLWLTYIKNAFPAMLMGVSTMSSLATMPITIKSAEKNTGNIDIARTVIPATVNMHLIGVSMAVPIMAIAILTSFGYEVPTLATFARYAIYSILALFSCAGVPGGGIYVMLPLLEEHFGFSAEMSGLITALYILFDPAVTVANVLGNSVLVIAIAKISSRFTTKTATVSD